MSSSPVESVVAPNLVEIALRKATSIKTAALLLGAASTQACVGGLVYDAETGAAVEDVVVTAYAGCLSPGCDGLIHTQSTDSYGTYVYDGYGDTGREQLQALQPAPGNETINLMFSRSGYSSELVYHHPDFETTEYEGKERAFSHVQDVYLCATGAPDADSDGLCDAAEAAFGTRLDSPDSDGDGLSDRVEIYGADGLDLAFYGADPLHKDIFVEADYFPATYVAALGREVSVKPSQQDLDLVIEAMDNAPVENPDGETGIHLHVLVDDEIAEEDAVDSFTFSEDMPVIKEAYFDSRRAPYFHYALFAYDDVEGAMGRGQKPGRDFTVNLLAKATEQVAKTFMHELGHNLGLGHGGQDSVQKKPHYFSIMNSRYPRVKVDGVNRLDFSRVSVAALRESSLDEAAAFAPAGDTTEADLAHYSVAQCRSGVYTGNASQNLDLNRDGRISSGPMSIDIGCEPGTDESWEASQVDWDVLQFLGRSQVSTARASADAGIAGSGGAASGTVGCDL